MPEGITDEVSTSITKAPTYYITGFKKSDFKNFIELVSGLPEAKSFNVSSLFSFRDDPRGKGPRKQGRIPALTALVLEFTAKNRGEHILETTDWEAVLKLCAAIGRDTQIQRFSIRPLLDQIAIQGFDVLKNDNAAQVVIPLEYLPQVQVDYEKGQLSPQEEAVKILNEKIETLQKNFDLYRKEHI